jgi:cytochrome c biogenesis protein CcmG, thiol:disulfide interchange protein DsbE
VPKQPREPSLRNVRVIGAVLGLVAAFAAFLLFGRSVAEPFKPYRLAPFLLPSLDNSADIDSRNYSGRGFVVNFFFSTCPPCRQELPILQAASEKLPTDVSMLGVVHFESRAKGAAFVAQAGLTYDVALDEEGFVAPNVGAITFPTTLFVNSSGVVVKRHLGAISADELQRGIDLVSNAS